MLRAKVKIGLDLDNTLICYDGAFARAAAERGLLPYDFQGGKQQLRDAIRKMKNGEIEWQKLQGYVYGKGIGGAALFEGVEEFLSACRKHDCEVFVVSHKTEYGHYDEERVSLRQAARDWLKGRRLGIEDDKLRFASTRVEKVDIIRDLMPEWFVDDLVEVYREPHFPREVKKVLFHTAPQAPPPGDHIVCRDWKRITQTVLGL